MDLWLRKGLKHLEPVDEAGADALRKIKLGCVVRCTISQPRNMQHHRKFFALVTTVWNATGEWPSVEDLLIELKCRLGITSDVVIRQTGEIVKVVGSISFAKMTQGEFDVFYERALRELCQMAHGISEQDLRDAVLDELVAA